MSHDLTIYDDDEHLATRVAAFLGDGVEREEAVVAVVDTRKWALLSDAGGPAISRVLYVDRDTFYSRPEAALADYDARVRRLLRDGAPGVRLFGELPLYAHGDVDAWTLYEAILNRAFADRPVTILCGYDAREQPAALIDGARRTHPRLFGDGAGNRDYHDPAEVARAHARPPELPLGLRALTVDDDAPAFRRRLERELDAEAIAADVGENLIVAVSEIVANARRHGDGIRGARIGRVGDAFVCEISDRGPGMDDPLAGYVPPVPDRAAGAGLWVARQLTQRLDLVSTADGLTVRLWARNGSRPDGLV